MDELDKKLEEILFKAAGGISDMAREEIMQIKQAFKDAGYIPYLPWSEVPDDQKPPQPDWWSRTPQVMTGQEFYARFGQSLARITADKHHGGYVSFDDAYEAAKKAAGIE